MSYVILQLAVTLDGFIAKKDGSVDFLNDIEPNFADTFNQFIEDIDVIVMGRSTYNQMISFGEIPYQDKRIFVLTTKHLESKYNHIEFINSNVNTLIEKTEGNIWLFGGANVIKQFIDNDLIDEMQLFIVPHILGEGIPLFLDNKGMKNLKLIRSENYGNNVFLIYRKQKH